MNHKTRAISLSLAATCAAVCIAAGGAGPASAATVASPGRDVTNSTKAPSSRYVTRLIIANMTDHDLDMSVMVGDGTTLTRTVKPHEGWYPEADYAGKDSITVRDSTGIAFVGNFTYDTDWVKGDMLTSPRLRYVWHTGPFGGFDFL